MNKGLLLTQQALGDSTSPIFQAVNQQVMKWSVKATLLPDPLPQQLAAPSVAEQPQGDTQSNVDAGLYTVPPQLI